MIQSIQSRKINIEQSQENKSLSVNRTEQLQTIPENSANGNDRIAGLSTSKRRHEQNQK
jgi:hypothetical protein